MAINYYTMMNQIFACSTWNPKLCCVPFSFKIECYYSMLEKFKLNRKKMLEFVFFLVEQGERDIKHHLILIWSHHTHCNLILQLKTINKIQPKMNKSSSWPLIKIYLLWRIRLYDIRTPIFYFSFPIFFL